MAFIKQQELQLTTVDTNTTVRVKYTAKFSPLDRFLAAAGLKWVERIEVLAVDGQQGFVLQHFHQETIPVGAGGGFLSVQRERSLTVPRSALQEDPDGETDEIRCRIKLVPIGLPNAKSAETEIRELLG
jgi:hypothetical protein